MEQPGPRALVLCHRRLESPGGVQRWARVLQSGLGASCSVLDQVEGGRPWTLVEGPEERVVHAHAWLGLARHHRDTWDDARWDPLVQGALRWSGADLLHLGHPDGWGIRPLQVARRLGVATVVTVHDWIWVCGRGQLVPPGEGPCVSAGSDRCPRCLTQSLARGPAHALLARAPLARALASRWDSRSLSQRGPAPPIAVERWHRRQSALIRALEDVDEVLAPSVFAAELLARHGLRREVVVLAHGIDAPEPRPLPDGPPRVAFFGTDLPSKGLDVLLRCWRALDGALPPLQVWGPIRPAAGAPAEFHGPYRPEDLPRLLSLQSIVAVPSLWPENRPFVVDEAHAAGRPVVASRIGGLPELVRDDVDGRLLPPGDLGSWTETFRSLARAPETVLRWAQAVRRPSGVAGFAAAHRRAYLRALS